MARGPHDQELHAAAQYPSARGGGCDRPQSVAPVAAPE